MPIPIEKIVETAKKEGFESELKVASALSGSGWQVNQNVYYIDKDEERGRELDINSYMIFSDSSEKPAVTCQIYLLIEVKRTSDPFIFFTSQPSQYETGRGYGLQHWKSRVNRHVLSYHEIERARPYNNPLRLGRSYCSLKDTSGQKIRSGILSSVKGCVFYKDKCNEIHSEYSHDICFFIPVLVADGPLYECFFELGSPDLTATEVATIIFSQNYMSNNYGEISAHVNVVTLGAFPGFLTACQDWGKDMLSTMRQNCGSYEES